MATMMKRFGGMLKATATKMKRYGGANDKGEEEEEEGQSEARYTHSEWSLRKKKGAGRIDGWER